MNHGIILRVALNDPVLKFYKEFGELLPVSGETFLLLSADQLEFDVHYLRVRLLSPEIYQGLVVWLPHRFVVLVFSDESNRKMGFLDA